MLLRSKRTKKNHLSLRRAGKCWTTDQPCAVQLTEEGYGSIACVALLAIGAENLVTNAMNADEVVILDGCPMLCAKKIANTQGISAGQHLVITELGITKGPSKSYTNDDIEKIIAACWKGEGRKKDTATPGKRPVEKITGVAVGAASPRIKLRYKEQMETTAKNEICYGLKSIPS